jgi:SAM-dependent methyltransferase
VDQVGIVVASEHQGIDARVDALRKVVDEGRAVVVYIAAEDRPAAQLVADLVAPIDTGAADFVIARGETVGLVDTALAFFGRVSTGTSLGSWRAASWACSTRCLAELPLIAHRGGTDGASRGSTPLEVALIVEIIEAGRTITEIVTDVSQSSDVDDGGTVAGAFRHLARYRLHKMGFGSGELAFASDEYEDKPSEDSSHGVVVRLLDGRPRRVLDLGCGPGHLGGRLRAAGHHVTGIDLHARPGVTNRLDDFVEADLTGGLPEGLGVFDTVLAADVFEHLPQPDVLLRDLAGHLGPSGAVLASIPNFAHWYPRLRVVTGRFDYDRRGILDRTHLRFFTRRSFERFVRSAGWSCRVVGATGLPFDAATRTAGPDHRPVRSRGGSLLQRVDHALVRLWPSLFAYQFVFELSPPADRAVG